MNSIYLYNDFFDLSTSITGLFIKNVFNKPKIGIDFRVLFLYNK